MTTSLQTQLLLAATDPLQRSEVFHSIGQTFLKPLHDRALQECVNSIWEYLCENEKSWKSNLMLPDYYRRDKKNLIIQDIWFTVRDYFAWCVLYPDEVAQYFTMNELGQVLVLENPKVRILDKDNKKDVYKSELGQRILVPVKNERSMLIKSGFTLGQKDDILTVGLVGLMAQDPRAVIKVVKSKPSAKKKLEAKTLLRQVVATRNLKVSLKQLNDLSLEMLDSGDVSLESAHKVLEHM